jgi:hypothetical protein
VANLAPGIRWVNSASAEHYMTLLFVTSGSPAYSHIYILFREGKIVLVLGTSTPDYRLSLG